MADIEDDKMNEESKEEVKESPEISEVEKLKKELAEEKDKAMRLYADFENFRRRTARERSEIFIRAAEDVYKEVLPVVDNFGRAMDQAGNDPFAEGVKMVYNQLMDFLKKGGVEPIASLDNEFNTSEHEAVAYQPSPDKPEGTVIYEIRRGYKMGDRVIRVASVIVSSGAPEAPANEATPQEKDDSSESK